MRRGPVLTAALFAALAAALVPAAPVAARAASSDSLNTGAPLQTLWNRHLGRCILFSPLVLPGRLVLASTDGKVQCVDLATGKRIWSRGIKDGATAAPVFTTVPDERVYLAGGQRTGRLSACETRRGRIKWTKDLPGPIHQLIAGEDRVWVLEKGGRVSCRAAADGHEIWNRTYGGWDPAGFVLRDSLLYVLARKDSLVALRTSDGHTRWVARPTGRFVAPPTLIGRQVAAVTIEGELTLWDEATGVPLGSQRRTGMQLTAPVRTAGRLVTASSGGVIEAQGDSGAASSWKLDLQEGMQAKPVPFGTLLLAATGTGKVHALGSAQGNEVWSLDVRGGFRAAPVLAGNRLILATDRGEVYVYAVGS